MSKTTNRVAVGDYVALAGASQRIPLILAVAVVYFFAVATVAVDATEGMKYVYNTTVPIGTVVSVFVGPNRQRTPAAR